MTNEQVLNDQEQVIENAVNGDQSSDYEESFTEEALKSNSELEEVKSNDSNEALNGLENFGVEENAPDLFNSGKDEVESQDLLSSETDEDRSEEDDLEIPAFLRRQKN